MRRTTWVLALSGLLLAGCVQGHVYYEKGNQLVEKRQWEPALQEYNQAIAADSRLTGAYLKRGLCFQRLGRYDEALADYNQAVALAPGNDQSYINRALFYDEQGDHRQLALNDLGKALELNKNSAYAYNLRGNVYLKLLQFENAILDYTESIRINPRDYTPPLRSR